MKLKLLLSFLWLLFTSSMVSWWWFYGMDELTKPNSAINLEARKRMLFWEGSFFLFAIFIGGFFLIYYLYKDNEKNKSLRAFFSIFSHDLKTSIARLRLQADVLREEEGFNKNKTLQRIVKDINKLDIQLENSLWLAQLENIKFLKEKFLFSDLISMIKSDFPEVSIELNKDIQVIGDKRSLMCVLRNLIQNAIIHGEADTLTIKLMPDEGVLNIEISDNGKGTNKLPVFQSALFPHFSNSSKTSGLGLNLCYQILLKTEGFLSARLEGNKIFFNISLAQNKQVSS